MFKKITGVLLLLFFILPSMCFALWRWNPYTGKMDYYENNVIAINNSGLFGNITNTTNVTKNAWSIIGGWGNATTNNASLAISLMNAGTLSERMNFTGANQIILLNTTTFMPSADGTTAINYANSTGSIFLNIDSNNKIIKVGASPMVLGVVSASNPTVYNLTSQMAFCSQLGYRFFMDSDNNTANTDFTIYGNNTTVAASTAYFTVIEPGNVGIGTTAPSQKLEIAGSGSIIRLYNATGVGYNCSINATNVFACTL